MKSQTLVARPSGDTAWNKHTTAEEDQRLSVLDERIERALARVEIMVQERARIRKRAAKRMKRALSVARKTTSPH